MSLAKNMYTTDPNKVTFKMMNERNEEQLVTINVPGRPRNARERMMYLYSNGSGSELQYGRRKIYL